jgi:hypothetical protein
MELFILIGLCISHFISQHKMSQLEDEIHTIPDVPSEIIVSVLNCFAPNAINILKAKIGSYYFFSNIIKLVREKVKTHFEKADTDVLSGAVSKYIEFWGKFVRMSGHGDCISNTYWIVQTLDNSLKDALNGIDPKTYLRVVSGTFYYEEEAPKGSTPVFKKEFHLCTCFELHLYGQFHGIFLLDPSRFSKPIYLPLQVEVKVKNQEIMRLKSETCIESFDLVGGTKQALKSIGYYKIDKVDYLDKNLMDLRMESIVFDRITLTIGNHRLYFDTDKREWIFNPGLKDDEKQKVLSEIDGIENMDAFLQLMKTSPSLFAVYKDVVNRFPSK